jgi:hypothetical protein
MKNFPKIYFSLLPTFYIRGSYFHKFFSRIFSTGLYPPFDLKTPYIRGDTGGGRGYPTGIGGE